jgi:hypothetical protein
MTRTKIRLDTLSDVQKFVTVMGRLTDQVWLEDGSGSRVNAKSMLGALYSMEFADIYCFCERDINAYLTPWAI